LLRGAITLGVVAGLACAGGRMAAADDAKPAGYQGVARSWLFNPNLNATVNTTKYKKAPPYTIGFSNASISNAWRVAFQHGILWAADQHRDVIKHFIVTDANDDSTKQISDVQDLINQGVDLLLIASATEDALDAVVGRAMKAGIPVVMVDRKVKTDANYLSFVTSSDAVVGRVEAQWLCEHLGGKGNIVMLPGIAGASPAELRIAAAKEVLGAYPDIHVLDMQYTNWNPATGKSVMAALIQKYGKKIDGVLADSALQGSGAIEAYVAAGYKAGEIPPMTGGDIAKMYQLSAEYKVPMIGIDYPPLMGIRAVQIALDVLAGVPVPRTVQVSSQIVITAGDDTASVKGDMTPAQYVTKDAPGDLAPANGLPAGYDPRTFTVNYPK
jgi:ribose transport system substrate-binding protein